jgi:hypothetical protein
MSRFIRAAHSFALGIVIPCQAGPGEIANGWRGNGPQWRLWTFPDSVDLANQQIEAEAGV